MRKRLLSFHPTKQNKNLNDIMRQPQTKCKKTAVVNKEEPRVEYKIRKEAKI